MRHQQLPTTHVEREALRAKGQFWTPSWIAESMVAYVLRQQTGHVFDPAVGAGAFFVAAKQVARQLAKHITLHGTEIDPSVLQQAYDNGLSGPDLSHITVTNFVLQPPKKKFRAIVANPPYIRHHRLSAHLKSELRKFGAQLIGKPLDGRAGLHVYFLLRALELLEDDGRLAFIMPADTCEGVFAAELWRWITRHYCLEVVVTFAPEASPFPGVDTNAIIFMIRKTAPQETFLWVRCVEHQTEALKNWTLSGFKSTPDQSLIIHRRKLSEALAMGLSRAMAKKYSMEGPKLGDFARVLRGIATGANDFFWLSREQATSLAIPDAYLLPSIGRTRDILEEEITQDTIKILELSGRPTLLLSLDGRPKELLPSSVRAYLEQGERLGLNKRALISTRNPWYKMETRHVPPFLFAYLGRRNSRFVRNRAGVIPLTGFLCVYPKSEDTLLASRLWEALRHPDTIANLRLVAKTYGGGAMKVEPRALERLPIPEHVLALVGLQVPRSQEQFQLEFN